MMDETKPMKLDIGLDIIVTHYYKNVQRRAYTQDTYTRRLCGDWQQLLFYAQNEVIVLTTMRRFIQHILLLSDLPRFAVM